MAESEVAVEPEAEVAVDAEAVVGADVAAGAFFTSSSATRFSSCSTRSSSIRSRSVNPGAGAFAVPAAALFTALLPGCSVAPSLLPFSSAAKSRGAALMHKNVPNNAQVCIPRLNVPI
jgi:hypothetical protein